MTPPGTERYTLGNMARNSVYSLLGQLAPIPVALISVPLIVDRMGIERFGVLTMAWIVLGYFSLFDLGIGRATTKFVAECAAQGRNSELRKLVSRSLSLLIALGTICMVAVLALTNWITSSLLNIPASLMTEAHDSFMLLAVAIPVMLLISGVRGVLEALQLFREINIIKVPSSVATYLAPLAIVFLTTDLAVVVLVLVLSRIITLILYGWLCWKRLPKAVPGEQGRGVTTTQLLKYGGWLSVSSLVAPLIGYADRFFIGSIITLAAVAYYSTPFDVMTKLFIIPGSILVVVFPAISAFNVTDTGKLNELYRSATKYILIIMTPFALILIGFAEPLMKLWLGVEFAAQSSLVVKILATGILFSSVARIPLNTTQAIGRPDISAKLYLSEFPLVILALYLLTGGYGIVGVASIWLVRIVLEAVFLVYYSNKEIAYRLPGVSSSAIALFSTIIGINLIGWLLAAIPSLLLRCLLTIVVMGIGGYLTFSRIIETDERKRLMNSLRGSFSSGWRES